MVTENDDAITMIYILRGRNIPYELTTNVDESRTFIKVRNIDGNQLDTIKSDITWAHFPCNVLYKGKQHWTHTHYSNLPHNHGD